MCIRDRATLVDLAAPLAWIFAVGAAVWFHIDVWRTDRAVIAAATPEPRLPPPPTASAATPIMPAPQPLVTAAVPSATAAQSSATTAQPSATAATAVLSGVSLRWATEADHGELFTLQRAAFVDEAVAYGTPDVPSLNETFPDFRERMATVPTLVAVDGTRLVGALSVRSNEQGHPWLERLMVAPDRRNEQLGHQLVRAQCEHLRSQGQPVMRAVVGDRNPQLIAFYTSLGFHRTGTTEAQPGVPELLIMSNEPA